ncbi:MAG TPA: hypothetical protein VNQ52_08645, partial [Microbacteriaceae bacterium]|nr:hypothetical protein [Microbacteriaceae bacterium]
PIPAAGTPSSGLAPTVVMPGSLDPTAATTVLAGGAGGGLPPSEPPRGGGFRDWDPRRKALFITLIAAAGVLLIALIVLLVVVLGGSGKDPDPDPTPTRTSATPTPTPTRSTPTPTPTPTIKPAIQSFSVDTNTAVCADTAAGTTVMLHFAWTVVGPTTQIAIASGANAVDAIASPFQNNLPATETRFPMPFGCNNAQLTYSLTAAGPDGQHYSGVVTVVRQYTPPAPVPNPTISSFNVVYDAAFDTCTTDPLSIANPTFNWATNNSTEVAIAVDHLASAFDGAYTTGLPSTGSATMPFDCTLDERQYTVSAKNSAGVVVTEYVTVFNPADPGGDGPNA